MASPSLAALWEEITRRVARGGLENLMSLVGQSFVLVE